MQIKNSEIKELVSVLISCKTAALFIRRIGNTQFADDLDAKIAEGLNVLEGVVDRKLEAVDKLN